MRSERQRQRKGTGLTDAVTEGIEFTEVVTEREAKKEWLRQTETGRQDREKVKEKEAETEIQTLSTEVSFPLLEREGWMDGWIGEKEYKGKLGERETERSFAQ
jgi:hypothetical protein